MIINSITPYGQSSLGTAKIAPRAFQNHHSSVSFTGSKKVGVLGTLAMIFGISACPGGNKPGTTTSINTGIDTATAISTDTTTSISTSTVVNTAVDTSTATSTSIIKDTTPADKFLNSLQVSGIAPADATEVPQLFQYTDTANLGNIVETLDTANTTADKLAYNCVATNTATKVVQPSTKTFEVVSGDLIQTQVATRGGVEFVTKSKITRDNGFMKFWMMDGTLDYAWKDIGNGKIGIFDRNNLTTPCSTLDNVMIDGSPIAKLESMMKRLGKKVEQKTGLAYETKSEGKTVKGIMHNAPELPELAGKIIKAASRARAV